MICDSLFTLLFPLVHRGLTFFPLTVCHVMSHDPEVWALDCLMHDAYLSHSFGLLLSTYKASGYSRPHPILRQTHMTTGITPEILSRTPKTTRTVPSPRAPT